MTYGVVRVGHSVEGSKLHGELVDNEVVCVVLRTNDSSESLLVLSATGPHVSSASVAQQDTRK